MAITLDGNSNVNLAFSSGGRITGDYTNATLLSRAMFQTSTTNGSTGIYALPNGTSTAASWQATNAADPTNASKVLIATNGSTDCQLVSGRNGTGTYLPLTFYTNGSEQMRLDTSGNLGLGVTPSGWGYTALQVKSGAIYEQSSTDFRMVQNAYYAAGNSPKYINTAAASMYRQESANHYWYNAPSGTAGNAISFTQAMTLDASGNLVVGAATAVGGSGGSITSSGPLTASGYLSAHQTSRAVIEINGNKCALRAYGATAGTGYWTFNVGGGGGLADTEAARIDASGNLLVGTTTAYGKIVAQGATDYQLYLNSTNTSAAYTALYFANQGVTKSIIYWYQNNNYLYVTNGTGGVYMTQNGTSWTSNSDERLKDVIEPITNAVSKVNSLRAVIGKFKTDEEGTRKPFLIAQDVEIALPEAVTRSKLARSEDETEYLGVAYTDTIPLLVAAIKELTARLEALENK